MLVSLSDMKTYLGIADTSYDTFLTEQLTLISEAVENYCGRKFLAATYKQTFYKNDYPVSQNPLMLFHFPVNTLTHIKKDTVAEDLTYYRLHKPTGKIVSDTDKFLVGESVLEVQYNAGYEYANLPKSLQGAVKSLVEERYNKKKSGVSLNFGSDVQRISIPGTLSIDFDYTLSSNERANSYGVILGSQANVIDFFRSERRLVGSEKIEFVEVVV